MVANAEDYMTSFSDVNININDIAAVNSHECMPSKRLIKLISTQCRLFSHVKLSCQCQDAGCYYLTMLEHVVLWMSPQDC